MDSTAAIVKADLSVVGYEWLFVKRDGKWIKVSAVMTWIS